MKKRLGSVARRLAREFTSATKSERLEIQELLALELTRMWIIEPPAKTIKEGIVSLK